VLGWSNEQNSCLPEASFSGGRQALSKQGIIGRGSAVMKALKKMYSKIRRTRERLFS